MKLNPIGAGDFIRTVKRLQPQDEAALDAIAVALGFDLPVSVRSAVSVGEQIDPERGVKTSRTVERERGPAIHHNTALGMRERRFELVPQKEKATAAPMRILAPQSSAPLPASGSEEVVPALPWQPLLKTQWSRAIVSTMARIRTPAGPPQVETLVERAAERKPMFSVPATVLETASGADVLVDVGDSMTVFSRDQQQMLELMRRVLGDGCVSAYRFIGSPLRGVIDDINFERKQYRPPPGGWPIVLLTDLGIGAGASAATTQEWRRFAKVVRSAGCHLLALVPYPPARWPPGLLLTMDILQWDRRTSVRTIKTAIHHVTQEIWL